MNTKKVASLVLVLAAAGLCAAGDLTSCPAGTAEIRVTLDYSKADGIMAPDVTIHENLANGPGAACWHVTGLRAGHQLNIEAKENQPVSFPGGARKIVHPLTIGLSGRPVGMPPQSKETAPWAYNLSVTGGGKRHMFVDPKILIDRR